MNQIITVEKEKRNEMIKSIKHYFLKERDEDLGDLSASLILDFIIKELAPTFYNRGIEDSYQYMNESIQDLLGLEK